MKQQGFTLIEMMIVVTIVGIVAALAFPAMFSLSSPSSISFGVTGMVEERCIGGYKFVIGQEGRPAQIINELGKGVPCGVN